MTRPLTEFQATVLFTVQQNGPVSVADVTYHLPVSASAARSRLETLERRGLIARTYTGHHRGSQFAYTLTDAGSEALAGVDEVEADDGKCDLCTGTYDAHSKFCMLHPDKVAARQRARTQPTGSASEQVRGR